MSRRVVVAAVLDGPWVRVKIAPGFARSLEEADALADVLMGRRLDPRSSVAEDETAATEGAA